MDFQLTDEQTLIQGSAMDWLSKNYEFRQRVRGVHVDGGSPQAWKSFAELGWLGLPLPQEFGGSAMGLQEAGLLMQAFGRHLVVEPYHACVLQAARLLALAGSPEQKADCLPAVIRGEMRLALAHAEPGQALVWTPPCCSVQFQDGFWLLEGNKQVVLGAVGAAKWVVSACEPGPAGRVLLLMVDPSLPGVQVDAYDTMDDRRAADITFDGVLLPPDALLCEPGESCARMLEQVLAEAVITSCWEAVGALQAVLEQTSEYVRHRKQFSQALSNFQVVQHRLAEMAVMGIEAQAACEWATMRFERAPQGGRDVASSLLVKVAAAADFVSKQAVQLHGAMGVCEELPVAATFRTLLAFSNRWGSRQAHARYVGALQVATGSYAGSQILEELA